MNYERLCEPEVAEAINGLKLKPTQERAILSLMMVTSPADPTRTLTTKQWGGICGSNTTVWKALTEMADKTIQVNGKTIAILKEVSYNACNKTLTMALSDEILAQIKRVD